MYSAKQLGKNRYQMFDARLERQILARVEMLGKVNRGLQDEQFELYYQPKVNFITGEVHSVEALLRWNDPTLGVLGANEVVPLVENESLAVPIGEWVIRSALQQAKCWHEQGITMPISINIFPRHLSHRSFVSELRKAVDTIWPELPPNRMVMEIVESTNLEEVEGIEQVINQCREMGFGFSLDDFGTGYSSLVYLRRLSIEELKIDQSFVRDMLNDPEDEAIVISVIELGKAFGLRVVAEGVETTEQAQHLTKLGCPIVQGYKLGHPMPSYVFESSYDDFRKSALKVRQ
jgi:EAL domain-containing protein (putative c-di-GMP-specific phosphodiesterase class I)